jgi:hypothetical protein
MDTLLGIGGGIVGGFAMSSAGLGGYGGTIMHNPGWNGWRSASDCARRLHQRKKDFRTAALSASGPETCRELAIRPNRHTALISSS